MSITPVGFAADYRRVRSNPATAEALSSLLSLVGYEATVEVVERWSAEKRVEAEVWAVNAHLRASDNILRRCPQPEWLPAPWQGPEAGDGVFAGPSGTVLE
jgi:hypothetical protein